MDVPDASSTIASLPAGLQAIVTVIVMAGSALIFVSGRLKKPSAEAGKLDDGDVDSALKHMKWIARHLERMADAAERANEIAERQLALDEERARPARAPPRPRKRPAK